MYVNVSTNEVFRSILQHLQPTVGAQWCYSCWNQ